MSDPVYTVVKASARKGRLLTREEFLELSYSKDLKELANKLKERVPTLEAPALSAKALEASLYSAYLAEVDEFTKTSDRLKKALSFFKREVTDTERAETLKSALAGNLPEKQREEPLIRLKAEGFDREVEASSKAFMKYRIPGLVDVAFARQRILDLCEDIGKLGREARTGLTDFVKTKVDYFNSMTIIRGLKNGVPPAAISELLIYQLGSIPDEKLNEATKQGASEKAAAFLLSTLSSKGSGARDLERLYEERLGKNAERAYYRNYSNLAAVFSYLELKLRETKNLIRLANIIEREMDPKKSVQEFIY
ncbi:MAG: H(+)-transporting two-sector ATPase [Candidatus Methanosuratincola subterraneus]|uniref:H(+)-transporting two-sector ATPase n=1 Tax=Methanosuratincola subterraneus TaxID=2593994 RepID=A0A3S3S766_METS7|nr:MAG: H(+)-transporting two-sector ATPase [Candidatus Methanosuratincola subterraneus]